MAAESESLERRSLGRARALAGHVNFAPSRAAPSQISSPRSVKHSPDCSRREVEPGSKGARALIIASKLLEAGEGCSEDRAGDRAAEEEEGDAVQAVLENPLQKPTGPGTGKARGTAVEAFLQKRAKQAAGSMEGPDGDGEERPTKHRRTSPRLRRTNRPPPRPDQEQDADAHLAEQQDLLPSHRSTGAARPGAATEAHAVGTIGVDGGRSRDNAANEHILPLPVAPAFLLPYPHRPLPPYGASRLSQDAAQGMSAQEWYLSNYRPPREYPPPPYSVSVSRQNSHSPSLSHWQRNSYEHPIETRDQSVTEGFEPLAGASDSFGSIQDDDYIDSTAWAMVQGRQPDLGDHIDLAYQYPHPDEVDSFQQIHSVGNADLRDTLYHFDAERSRQAFANEHQHRQQYRHEGDQSYREVERVSASGQQGEGSPHGFRGPPHHFQNPPLPFQPPPPSPRQQYASAHARADHHQQQIYPHARIPAHHPHSQHGTRRDGSLPHIKPSSEELDSLPTPRTREALIGWYRRLNQLIDYRNENGNCNVPQKWDGIPGLGIWVNKQRMEKKFLDEGNKSSMTESKIAALESIGFDWGTRKGEKAWEQKFEELRTYKEKHGDCDVPTKYRSNRALGRWVSTQRSHYKKWKKRGETRMTAERVKRLEAIGFTWNRLGVIDLDDEEEEEEGEETSDSSPSGRGESPSQVQSRSFDRSTGGERIALPSSTGDVEVAAIEAAAAASADNDDQRGDEEESPSIRNDDEGPVVHAYESPVAETEGDISSSVEKTQGKEPNADEEDDDEESEHIVQV